MTADNDRKSKMILPLAFNPKINWNVFWRIFLLPLAPTFILLLLFLLYGLFIDSARFGWNYFGSPLLLLILILGIAFWLYVPPAALTALLAAKMAFKPRLSSCFALALLATGLHIGWGLLYLKEFIVFYSLVPLFYALTAWWVFKRKRVLMWEAYLRDIKHRPTQVDRQRLEAIMGGKLPDAYWKLVCAHQGKILNAMADFHDAQGRLIFTELEFGILLLAISPNEAAENFSYSIEYCLQNMRGYYPDKIMPFADDTGGNYWAFDFRDTFNAPKIVFVDHKLEGEEGISYVSDTFDAFMSCFIKK